MKIAILGSTRGTDLEGIIDAIQSGTLRGVDIQFVLSNKKDAYILERARSHNIPALFLDPTGLKRTEYDSKLSDLLEASGVELILLIGYMKILSNAFVERWKNKVMNIHPSLLPAYTGGMDRNVHAEVLARGCKLTGASLIFIDQGADTGPIIMQRSVPVLDDDDVDSLKHRVQLVEQEILIEVLALYRDGRVKVIDDKVKILG